MSKPALILFFAFAMSLLFQTGSIAQENDSTQFEIIINKMRLPFPASKDKKAKYYSLDDEAALVLAEATKELGFYDIVVGIYLDSTSAFEDSTFGDFAVLNFNEVTRFSEAIIIIATEISQQGVPSDEDDAYFLLGDDDVRKKSGNYSKNIQTQLSVNAVFIDIETGESQGLLDLEVFHTGGTLKRSKAKAMSLLKKKAKAELERIYWFSADVIKTKKGMMGIAFGTNSKIKKGLIFELVEPDRIWKLDDEEVMVPGSYAAIVTVVDASADSSGFRILRQWRDVYPGSWAVEHPKSIFALGLNLMPPATDAYTNLGIYFHAGAVHDFDWGIGMQIMRVTDSFGDDDYGFGFDAFAMWRFLNTTKIDFGSKMGMDFDIPFRKDDDERMVHTLLFSAHIGIVGEFLLSQQVDFVINAGYRFGVKSGKWEYSEDEESYPAYWEKGSPKVDNSGLMLSVGFKYFLL
jgi:hypothetical protein